MFNSLAAVIHKNKRDAAGNSEKVLHPCCRGCHYTNVSKLFSLSICKIERNIHYHVSRLLQVQGWVDVMHSLNVFISNDQLFLIFHIVK